ncbi:MAG TPA: hypothetical protein VFA26_14320 [Gemmataceae bacterium]|nr:hypothetical protein [Gemmataceae bacterium]
MKRTAVLCLVMLASGCSTAPLADLLDWVKPAQYRPVALPGAIPPPPGAVLTGPPPNVPPGPAADAVVPPAPAPDGIVPPPGAAPPLPAPPPPPPDSPSLPVPP